MFNFIELCYNLDISSLEILADEEEGGGVGTQRLNFRFKLSCPGFDSRFN